MDKKDLIFKLISLKVNDASFKENEEEIINNLRELYRKNKDSFSKEDIKIIKIIDDIKELSEDIQYCRSKESIEQVIADFHEILGNAKDNENLTQRIKVHIKTCSEKKSLLPSEESTYIKRKKIQSFGPPPPCPKCEKLMILRDSSYGYFWGCIDFPTCWGKRSVKNSV